MIIVPYETISLVTEKLSMYDTLSNSIRFPAIFVNCLYCLISIATGCIFCENQSSLTRRGDLVN